MLLQRLLFNHIGEGALPRSDPNLSAPEKGGYKASPFIAAAPPLLAAVRLCFVLIYSSLLCVFVEVQISGSLVIGTNLPFREFMKDSLS